MKLFVGRLPREVNKHLGSRRLRASEEHLPNELRRFGFVVLLLMLFLGLAEMENIGNTRSINLCIFSLHELASGWKGAGTDLGLTM